MHVSGALGGARERLVGVHDRRRMQQGPHGGEGFSERAWSKRGAKPVSFRPMERERSRRVRGAIERLPSGSLRVRVYNGLDPATGKRRYLTETVPAGPHAVWEAEVVRSRLLHESGRQEGRAQTPTDAPTKVSPGGPDERFPPSAVRVPPEGISTHGEERARLGSKLTLRAIAGLAGVSTSAVSKVLNGRPGVGPQTRQDVEALLAEYGYQRPRTVRPASSVEVVFHGMLAAPAVDIMGGVEQVMREHQLTVGFTDVLRHPSVHRFWSEDVLARRPAGVIVVELGYAPDEHARLVSSAVPLVAIDPTRESVGGVPTVSATNFRGGMAAARHLVDLGHRRIAVITGPTDRLSAKARLEGVENLLGSVGLQLDPQLVCAGWFTFADGLGHGQKLLERPARPTAVLCGNDLQALGVYEAARRAGLRIPDDLSVVGFDDISSSEWCGPPLTTVRQPFVEIGATAARMLLSMANGQQPDPARVEHATMLVVRQSTAPPPPLGTGNISSDHAAFRGGEEVSSRR
jgi:LacI family transcriptional regulator, xylobiose transport system transcriptional regulator